MQCPSDHILVEGSQMTGGLKLSIAKGRVQGCGRIIIIPSLWVIHHEPDKKAALIQRAYRSWRWRKDVLWNPHTELGARRLALEAARACSMLHAETW